MDTDFMEHPDVKDFMVGMGIAAVEQGVDIGKLVFRAGEVMRETRAAVAALKQAGVLGPND